jgi:hypothetical protein
MADAETTEEPRGLADALTTLKEVVSDVLRRLPTTLSPRCALAYLRAPWWEKGKAAGFSADAGFLCAPATPEWPDKVKVRKVEMERDAGSTLVRLFHHGDLTTAAFGRIVAEELESIAATTRTRSFSSNAFRTGAYDLVAIVELDAEAYERYPAFRAPSATQASATVTVGLVDAALRAAFRWYSEKISPDLSDKRYVFRGDVDAILRNAATIMLADAERIVSGKFGFGQDLFLSLDSISALNHEGEECRASLVLTPSPTIDTLRPLRFREEVPIREAVWVRKLLGMATPPFVAVSDGENVVGLAQVTPPSSSGGPEFTVLFEGHHRWSLASGRVALGEFRLGFPSYPAEPLGRQRFGAAFDRIFAGRGAGADMVWPVVEAVISAHHGALVVVTDDAEQEAERLSHQSTTIVPTQLSPEQARRASKIDGALLLDPSGACHAVGVILDGEAVGAGSRSRGARFNSALRYVYGAAGRLAVVHSEDGHVDLLPRLRPQVRRSDLERELAKIRDAGDDVVTRKALREMAERIVLYAGDLDISEDDWMLVVRFLVGRSNVLEDDPPRSEYDPHPSDFLPDATPDHDR